MTAVRERPIVVADGPAAVGHALPQSRQSCSLARAIVRDELAGLAPDTVETAEMLVTELVANGVLHARSMLVLHLTVAGDRVWAGVEDLSFDYPDPQEPSPDAENGRGLLVLGELASSWGWDRTPTGKLVWFELPDSW
jgi:anti-sigma regulatory factor (Ser/Thr protein kinase)